MRHAIRSMQRTLVEAVAGLGFLALMSQSASAVVVELKDVAPDRIERQLREAVGQIPLPGTPNLAQFKERLEERGLSVGDEVFIRVFKAESELEIWMRRGDRYVHFATYPVCHWSGTLGPKLFEGDKQTPEGIYTVTWRQLHMVGRHPRSLNLGFPNTFDQQHRRTGSYILIHGACSSVGCFAMTNPVIEEIFTLSQAALRRGQRAIQVHSFPFRLTEERLAAYADSEWQPFWRNLKDAYDSFERTHLPPRVSICGGRYHIEDASNIEEVASQGPLAQCGAGPELAAPLSSPALSARLTTWPDRSLELVRHPTHQLQPIALPAWHQPSLRALYLRSSRTRVAGRVPSSIPGVSASLHAGEWSSANSTNLMSAATGPVHRGREHPSRLSQNRSTIRRHGHDAERRPAIALRQQTAADGITGHVRISCNTRLTSCRRWIFLQQQAAEKRARQVAERPYGRNLRRGGV